MKAVLATLILLSTHFGYSAYKGSIQFSSAEIQNHRAQITELSRVAARCLEEYQEEHLSYFDSNCHFQSGKKLCLSKFYGERRYSKFKGQFRPDGTPLTYLGDELRKYGFPISKMDEMENTSCVGMALDCLKQGFLATGQSNQWDKILRYTKANGVGGTALQDGLSRLGWKTYYWNPAPASSIIDDMKRWDAEEKNWQSKGYHAYRYNNVKKKGTYWFNKVDNSTDLVGFGQGEPKRLQNVPFWVGTAHTGYHVFPGTLGDVVEAHSTRNITAEDNLEFSRFSPFAQGGGPRWTRTEKYRSGLIVIPPGY